MGDTLEFGPFGPGESGALTWNEHYREVTLNFEQADGCVGVTSNDMPSLFAGGDGPAEARRLARQVVDYELDNHGRADMGASPSLLARLRDLVPVASSTLAPSAFFLLGLLVGWLVA